MISININVRKLILKLVSKNIKDAKKIFYHKTFTAYKNDMKKTWATINETLNKNKNKNDFPPEYIINNKSITDSTEIANHFNNYFANIGLNLASNIDLVTNSYNFNDYLVNPTDLEFRFKLTTENEALLIT